MISTSCQSSSSSLVHQLADNRIRVQQIVRENKLRLVVDPLEQERHGRVKGVALSEEQHPVKLRFLVAIEFEVDDLVFAQARQIDVFGKFENLRDRLRWIGMAQVPGSRVRDSRGVP